MARTTAQAAGEKKRISARVATQPGAARKDAKVRRRPTPRIVGMGGSAGGLEAFEQFFQQMPSGTGLAFVLVPHLDPTHKGILPELLQRCTRMQVLQAEDGVRVRGDCIYVIPPNKDMSVLHGKLQLLDPGAPRGLRMPIDFFFRHLAADQKDRAVCILLSGMGTDGTLGLKAVKEHLGMAMVQDPKTASYDGMPLSAIGTGLVDYVADAGELPAMLCQYVAHVTRGPKQPQRVTETPGKALDKIFVLLRARTGNDFSCYKKSTVMRRIERRMSIHQIRSMPRYVQLLQDRPAEQDLLFKELLIGVTNFFRDPEAFEVMRDKALPALLRSRLGGTAVRCWVPACSTGEDAYSLAMVLRECMEKDERFAEMTIQVFATDLDDDAIDKARQGVYPANIATDVSAKRLARFFARDEDHYRVGREIRDLVVFAQQNLIADPPFTKVDVVCCRNLLIYLSAETQRKVLPLLHYALSPGGVLMLGSAETVGSYADLFEPVDAKSKIYRRKEPSHPHPLEFPSPLSPPERKEPAAMQDKALPPRVDIEGAAQRSLLDHYVPPAVVITPEGDILYVNGRTGKFLEPPSGKADWNIFAMAREGLRQELGIAVRHAVRRKSAVTVSAIKTRTNGSSILVDLTVRPAGDTPALRNLLLVAFQEAPGARAKGKGGKALKIAPRSSGAVAELEQELRHAKEQLQTTLEEMETTQEELRSANEELQSNNEELQSTNEELTTSKEELQSLNEEMQTVNAELQSKVEDLSRANSDMKNLLDGIEVATIFLDNELKVKRFTPQATEMINLIASDIGRPIGHIVANLRYDRLVADAKETLASLVPRDVQVEAASGRWYMMRLLPYRTSENVVDGLVITFADITAMKALEAEGQRREESLEEARALGEAVIGTIREPLVVLDGDMHVVSASQAFYRTFGVTPSQTERRCLFDLGDRQWDIPALRKLLEDVLPKQSAFHDFRVEHDFRGVGRKVLLLDARRLTVKGGQALILLAMEDVTEKKP